MTAYLLDANVFIQAKNLHYGFDFCPAFWDWLVAQNQAGKVASIEKVADELHAGEDELATWAEDRGDDFFLRPTANRILRVCRDKGLLRDLIPSSGRRAAVLCFPELLNIAEGADVF